MAAGEKWDDPKYTGFSKYFNSYTIRGRSNWAKLWISVYAIAFIAYKMRKRKSAEIENSVNSKQPEHSSTQMSEPHEEHPQEGMSEPALPPQYPGFFPPPCYPCYPPPCYPTTPHQGLNQFPPTMYYPPCYPYYPYLAPQPNGSPHRPNGSPHSPNGSPHRPTSTPHSPNGGPHHPPSGSPHPNNGVSHPPYTPKQQQPTIHANPPNHQHPDHSPHHSPDSSLHGSKSTHCAQFCPQYDRCHPESNNATFHHR